jgi:hypothetical protein
MSRANLSEQQHYWCQVSEDINATLRDAIHGASQVTGPRKAFFTVILAELPVGPRFQQG